MDGPQARSADPAAIRAGDPAALSAFCAARGPAVLAFAATVLPPELAVQAAAEALARFRAALTALEGLQVDDAALLRGATRRAVAAVAPPPGDDARPTCAHVPELLAERLEGALDADEADRLDRHLARCEDCRALAERFAAAERAYDAPPGGTLPPEVARILVGALHAAGPLADRASDADGGDDEVPEPMTQLTEDVPVAPHPRDPSPPALARPRRHLPTGGDQGLLRTVVLPLAVVGAAAVAAMGIAGVFDDDAPEPAATTPPITQPVQTIAPMPSRRQRTTPAPAAGGGGLGVPGPGSAPQTPDAVAP